MDWIDNVQLFDNLPVDQKHQLEHLFEIETYQQNEFVCIEGDPGDAFFIIIEGEVEIIKALGTPRERPFGIRGPSDYFGEMSLIEKAGLRSASVKALTTLRLASLSRKNFDSMLARWPELVMDMLRELSTRLQEAQVSTIQDLYEKNIQLTNAYEELRAAQSQIIEKEKLEKELQLAHKIQTSFLPIKMPEFANHTFGARMVTARAVGGDLYDFIPLKDGSLGILIGDASDKGVPAALFMALTRSLFRAEATRYSSPSRVLSRVNNLLLSMNELNMFVTVLYGILDAKKQTFHYARAGHELPLLIDRFGDPYPQSFQLGQMLGIFPSPAFDESEIVLTNGDILLLYSDGVTDSIYTSTDESGIDWLKKNVKNMRSLPTQEFCDEIVNQIIDTQGLNPLFDDITLLAIRKES